MRFPYQSFNRPHPSVSLNGRRDQPRPIVSVTLIGPSGSCPRDAQIDCGSDESLFSENVAQRIGLDLTNAPAEVLGGQGGGQFVARFALIQLRMSDGVEFRE